MSPPMLKVDVWIFLNHWSSCWLCWISSSSRATIRNNHMFSSSSPPRYIGWIRGSGRPPYQHAPASDPLVHVDAKAAQLQTPCQAASFRPLPLGLKLTCLPSVPLDASLGVLPLATCQNPSARHDWPYDSFNNPLWLWLRGQMPEHQMCALMKVSR